MKYIDLSEAHRLAQKAVKFRGPDFKYQDMFDDTLCQYVAYDTEGNEVAACLVGVALTIDEAGNDSLFYWLSGLDENVLVDELAYIGESAHLFEMTPDAVRFLRTCQSLQDDGKTWGEALQAAINDTYKENLNV